MLNLFNILLLLLLAEIVKIFNFMNNNKLTARITFFFCWEDRTFDVRLLIPVANLCNCLSQLQIYLAALYCEFNFQGSVFRPTEGKKQLLQAVFRPEKVIEKCIVDMSLKINNGEKSAAFALLCVIILLPGASKIRYFIPFHINWINCKKIFRESMKRLVGVFVLF